MMRGWMGIGWFIRDTVPIAERAIPEYLEGNPMKRKQSEAEQLARLILKHGILTSFNKQVTVYKLAYRVIAREEQAHGN
jgi:hypothetical protein